MASLCTSACEASLAELATAVEAGCGSAMLTIDSQNITFSSWIDHMQYKVGLICLADTNTSGFCLDDEKTCVAYLDLQCFLADSVGSWNITEMVLNKAATWPNNTYKCCFNGQIFYWEYVVDENNICYSPFDFGRSDAIGAAGSTQLAALDYYIERGDPIDDDNYGWPLPLEFDEYHLEIQCSSCFLQTFKYGLENKWGDISQVWDSMKANCNLDDTITPANDFSNALAYGAEIPVVNETSA
ncbi:uncharacterized protein PAC_15727 [Phialocephala subalpina]|uniref:Uncharacterized protein n=1 Tax=Phialocephala subalpina TaxID=576137 RepID=A0A1L7XLL0_9HELO|nr:uncharacterized protein PAC_15727 [Phialocephala subalpina]